jgi:transcriptional regulator with XRE-family HTH domain
MSEARTLGSIVKSIRTERGWTLSEMSQASGIPLSTLSKIEHDKLTLTYDKLQQFSRALDIPLSELFAESRTRDAVITARRSVATLDSAVTIKTPNYVYHYLCSDLRQRRMLPVQIEITAKTMADFGDLLGHDGEEFTTVLEGAVVFHSEFYSPVTLHEGEGIYIDSNMGHAYLVADGYERATIVSICASDDEHLQERLIAEAESRGAIVERGRPPGQAGSADKKKAA